MQQLRKQKWGTTALAATIQKNFARPRPSVETAQKFCEKIQPPKNLINILHLRKQIMLPSNRGRT